MVGPDITGDGSASACEQLFESVGLTDKERAVARHLLAGLSSPQIAALEQNSPKTIRQHVSQIYAKCGVSSRAQFFRFVYDRKGAMTECALRTR